MFESGAVICLGLSIWFSRCSWNTRMWMLSHPLFIDIVVFILLTALHWGTFSGVMGATVGALMCSVLLTIGRKCFGHRDNSGYHRGYWDVSKSIKGN